ncbi:MAG: hypothetical protein MJ235_04085 [archaeon]|nr:hypothetical protein [archaeon]
MTLKIIENKKIRSNKRSFDNFLERYHDTPKNFKIDCESVNANFFSSFSTVTIRHKKPAKDSIYYAEVFKERDETVYFFGLARDPIIAASNYLSQESHIVPILVASLHIEDSSKSNIVFASDSKEINNVILLRIDCSELNQEELDVLKNKNKITKIIDGKCFINFGPIGDFKTLKNIRNFISNVKFEYDNSLYVKIIEVSIPDNYNDLKPDNSIVKDRFYNFYNIASEDDSEDVIDINDSDEVEEETDSVELKDTVLNSSSAVELSGSGDLNQLQNLDEIDSHLYKYYYIDNNDLFIEMNILKKDFFKNMQILNNFSTSYVLDMDFIEILDMDDELLNITFIFLINSDENTKNIKSFLDLNEFIEKL